MEGVEEGRAGERVKESGKGVASLSRHVCFYRNYYFSLFFYASIIARVFSWLISTVAYFTTKSLLIISSSLTSRHKSKGLKDCHVKYIINEIKMF